MEANVYRKFDIALVFTEDELYDLLLEMSEISKTNEYVTIQKLKNEIEKAIDANKGQTLLETE